MGFWGTLGNVMLGGLAAGEAPEAKFQHQGQLEGLINQGLGIAGNRQAPQVASGPQDQFRSGQMSQVGQLQGIASGQQKGAGELAAGRQAQNALAAQQAMARMGRGPNAALAARNAAQNAAGINLAASGMAQQSALQDQQMAQNALSQALGQGRGQDLQLAGQNAQLQAQTNSQNDALYQAMLGQLYGMDRDQMAQQFAAWQANKSQQGMLPGLISAGGQIGAAAAMSDARQKVLEPEDAGERVDEMLSKISPMVYSYRDQKYGEGARVGIMAQDLERSELGRGVVDETPEGKMLDVNKALSLALAAVARLNERVSELEAKIARG